MKQIKISKELSLPIDIVTQTVAILAKRRAGKSYTMRKIIEQIAAADQQIVIVDPKGDQWGVRSSADGKKAGLPIVILGGEHGDVPLEANSGELVAKLVVEDRVSVLLDLSMFRKSELATFMTGFLENLYRLKAKEAYRTPVCLVIDEADAVAPQKPQRGEERMLGAAEDIVRRGGQRGIGCILVTQRSAVLNKNVLTQAQLLIALRTIAPQDLAAMNAWIDVHGTIEQKKTLMESLPALPTGDAWFWSPGWPDDEGIFKRVHVLPIETFDSGATPKAGEVRREPKTIADVDLNVLKKQMASTIEKMKSDNPTVLKKRIAELEKQLAAKPEPKVIRTGPVQIKTIEKPVVGKRTLDKLTKALAAMKKIDTHMFNAYKAIEPQLRLVENYMTQFENDLKKIWMPIITVNPSELQPRLRPEDLKPGRIVAIPGPAGNIIYKPEGEKIYGTLEKKIYSFLYENSGHAFTKIQVAAVTGYSPTSSSFQNGVAKLNAAGIIRREGTKLVLATVMEGLYLMGERFSPAPAFWANKLPAAELKIYELLWIHKGVAYTKDYVAENTGYSVTSSSFQNALAHLNSIGLIRREPEGHVKINPDLENL